MTDYCSLSGARQIVATIADYWHRRGYLVNLYIEPMQARGDQPASTVYCVRSDIGPSGFPANRIA
jgi:hypothetical protein